MGHIFYLMGKSASGKDTMAERLLSSLPLKPMILYTTRPPREFEQEGVEYHFTGEERLSLLEKEGRVVEKRTYQTVHGPWIYATVDEGQWDFDKESYLAIGTLSSFVSYRRYFGKDRVIPLYLEVEDGERLKRAMEREQKREKPDYEEMCRRFLADQEDFSEEKLKEAGVEVRYHNQDFESCFRELFVSISQSL
ncbi:MAG: guanylate kinase [Blautia sp.]|nr:guanylate kinase [Blautia sp.]